MQGRCYYCNKDLNERTIKRHIKSCPEMKNVIKKQSKGGNRGQFIISIKDKYDKNTYCIYVSIDENLQLEHLDGFIRDVWVECCGHLSCFKINGELYNSYEDYEDFYEESYQMDMKLKDVLSVNQKFEYYYDFGSTTELILEVIDYIKVPKNFSQIEIVARNNEVIHSCYKCGKDAKYFNWNEEVWICDSCVSDEEDEIVEFEYTNSPRDGVCGYKGNIESEKKYMPGNNEKYEVSKKNDKSSNKPKYHFKYDLDDLDDLDDFDYEMFEDMFKGTIERGIKEIDNMFKKGIYSFDINELLLKTTKERISDIGEHLGIKISKSLKKAEMINLLVPLYKDLVKKNLNLTDQDEYNLFRKYLSNDLLWCMEEDNAQEFIISSYLYQCGIVYPCYKDEVPAFVMPKIVSEVIKESDTFELRKTVKENTRILGIFKGMIKAYGVFTIDEALNILKRYGIDITGEELARLLIKIVSENSTMYVDLDENNNMYFINLGINNYMEFYESRDKELEYAFIKESEIISMGEEDYLLKTKFGKEFIKQLSNLFVLEKEECIDFMDIMADDIQEMSSHEILEQFLISSGEKFSTNERVIIFDVIDKFTKNIPLWKHKGYTKKAMSASNSNEIKRNTVGRNDPCPCGSGKKYKKCCGRNNNVIEFKMH